MAARPSTRPRNGTRRSSGRRRRRSDWRAAGRALRDRGGRTLPAPATSPIRRTRRAGRGTSGRRRRGRARHLWCGSTSHQRARKPAAGRHREPAAGAHRGPAVRWPCPGSRPSRPASAAGRCRLGPGRCHPHRDGRIATRSRYSSANRYRGSRRGCSDTGSSIATTRLSRTSRRSDRASTACCISATAAMVVKRSSPEPIASSTSTARAAAGNSAARMRSPVVTSTPAHCSRRRADRRGKRPGPAIAPEGPTLVPHPRRTSRDRRAQTRAARRWRRGPGRRRGRRTRLPDGTYRPAADREPREDGLGRRSERRPGIDRAARARPPANEADVTHIGDTNL